MSPGSLTVSLDQRVLVLAPAGDDARLAVKILTDEGLQPAVCGNLNDLCAAIGSGAGGGLIGEEALLQAGPPALSQLLDALAGQPAWSDFPLLVLTRRHRHPAAHRRLLRALARVGNVSILERPLRRGTLINAVQVALRARQRQYQMRDHLRQHEQQELLLRELNETLEQRAAERAAVAERRAAQLRALAAELTQAEQRERRRLAELLHDHLQQLLVAANLSVGAVRRRSLGDADERLEQVAALLDEAIDASRSLAVELCPPILYDCGLAAALEWLGRQMHEKHGLNVTVEAAPDAEPDADDTRIFAFQAARELLFNIVKHAPEAWARVTLSAGPHIVSLCVEDDGPGVPADVFDRDPPLVGGFGLLHIRERADLIGGRLELRNLPGRGTCFTLTLPRHNAEPIAPE